MVVAVNYTNYSPLITTIREELHATSGQVGLFSTLLFLGLALAYIPAGILGDRIGARPVLIGSCALMGVGAILLPLFPDLFWGLLSASSMVFWFFVNDGRKVHTPTPVNLKLAVRSPAIWTLGLSHLGTFGLGNAIAAWITIYLVTQYGLPLATAATIGAIALLGGVVFRPLGGILLNRKIIGAIPLLRVGTIMGCIGVGLLAIPLRFPPFAVVGMALIAIGSTIPYTSVFNSAANLRSAGKGVAQGILSVISSPTVIIGPPLIGFLVDRTGNFLLAFGSIMLFGVVAIVASFLAGPALKREAVGEP
jgi:nitrate/nitrite transporter NarK